MGCINHPRKTSPQIKILVPLDDWQSSFARTRTGTDTILVALFVQDGFDSERDSVADPWPEIETRYCSRRNLACVEVRVNDLFHTRISFVNFWKIRL